MPQMAENQAAERSCSGRYSKTLGENDSGMDAIGKVNFLIRQIESKESILFMPRFNELIVQSCHSRNHRLLSRATAAPIIINPATAFNPRRGETNNLALLCALQ